MLKSFLISLRRKPKAVRDQAAMIIAGVFTLAVFGVWALSVPGKFTGAPTTQSAGFFSSFTAEFGDDVEQLKETSVEIQNLIASTTVTDEAIVIDGEVLPLGSDVSASSSSDGRVVRISTTTNATSSKISE